MSKRSAAFADRTYTVVLTSRGWVQRKLTDANEPFVRIRRRETPDASGGTNVTFDVHGMLATTYAAECLSTARTVATDADGVRLAWNY